jgi:hypothetical protein
VVLLFVLKKTTESMRNLQSTIALAACCTAFQAGAAEWLDARTLSNADLRHLCADANEVMLLARMQMVTAQNAQWRRLSRESLAIEVIAMGAAPLDPAKCYVVARAGGSGDLSSGSQRRAFEVRDFSHSPEQTRIMVIGPNTPL